MRHGLTLGELARWFVAHAAARRRVRGRRACRAGRRARAPGFGWPLGERTWVNPSPNAANLSMARCYPGTVMLEGTTLSEGRGTTRPLELFGAPDLDARALIATMRRSRPRGCAAAGCARAGSSRPSTSTSARSAPACRSTSTTRPTTTTLPPVAPRRARAARRCARCARLPALARLPLRVRARSARHRRHQRRRSAAPLGRRPRRDARRPRRDRPTRRGGVARRARSVIAVSVGRTSGV